MCCSVLRCVAVCCRVLQCVAVWCRVLQHVAVCCSVVSISDEKLEQLADCWSVLQWAHCRRVLQWAHCRSVLQWATAEVYRSQLTTKMTTATLSVSGCGRFSIDLTAVCCSATQQWVTAVLNQKQSNTDKVAKRIFIWILIFPYLFVLARTKNYKSYKSKKLEIIEIEIILISFLIVISNKRIFFFV